MTYRLSMAAEKDVIYIFIDGAMLFGPEQAELYHDGLEATFKMLAEYPHSGKEYRSIKPPVRVFTFQSHPIVYTASKKDIFILRILHGRQDWVKHLN